MYIYEKTIYKFNNKDIINKFTSPILFSLLEDACIYSVEDVFKDFDFKKYKNSKKNNCWLKFIEDVKKDPRKYFENVNNIYYNCKFSYDNTDLSLNHKRHFYRISIIETTIYNNSLKNQEISLSKEEKKAIELKEDFAFYNKLFGFFKKGNPNNKKIIKHVSENFKGPNTLSPHHKYNILEIACILGSSVLLDYVLKNFKNSNLYPFESAYYIRNKECYEVMNTYYSLKKIGLNNLNLLESFTLTLKKGRYFHERYNNTINHSNHNNNNNVVYGLDIGPTDKDFLYLNFLLDKGYKYRNNNTFLIRFNEIGHYYDNHDNNITKIYDILLNSELNDLSIFYINGISDKLPVSNCINHSRNISHLKKLHTNYSIILKLFSRNKKWLIDLNKIILSFLVKEVKK